MILIGFVLVAIGLVHALRCRKWLWVLLLSLSLPPLFISYVGLPIAVLVAGAYLLSVRLRPQEAAPDHGLE